MSALSGTNSSTNTSSKFEYFPVGMDPYADVRDTMEELSNRDRQMYVSSPASFVKSNNSTHFNKNSKQMSPPVHDDDGIPPVVAYFVYLSYAALIIMGHLRDLGAILLQRGRYLRRSSYNHSNGDGSAYPSDEVRLYAPLFKSWENFFTRRLHSRIQDVFNRPISSNPGATIHVLERVSDNGQKSMQLLGSLNNLDTDAQRHEYANGPHFVTTDDGRVARRCLHLGSYNYLGFADDWADTCAQDVKGSLDGLSVSVSSSRNKYGSTVLHRELERTVAAFLGKPDLLFLTWVSIPMPRVFPLWLARATCSCPTSLIIRALSMEHARRERPFVLFDTMIWTIWTAFCVKQSSWDGLARVDRGEKFWLSWKVFIPWRENIAI